MIFVLRMKDGYIEYVNKTAEEMLGYSAEEMRQLGVAGFRRPLKENEEFITHLEELQEKGKMTDYAFLICKDGREFPIEVNARIVEKEGVEYNIAIVRDISEQFELESRLKDLNSRLEGLVEERTHELKQQLARLEAYKQAMDVNSIVSFADLQGKITYANENFCRVTGYALSEVIGKPHSIVRHPETDREVFRQMWKTIQSKKVWTGVLKNRKKSGDAYIVDIAILPILDADGNISEYLAIRHEITEVMEKKEALQRLLYEDRTTGYWSRYKLLKDIETAEHPTLCYIDIDQFNQINDFYGIEFGDRLLREFGDRLCSHLGCQYRYYRLQGDEFAILAEGESEPKNILRLSSLLSQRSVPDTQKQEFTLPEISFEKKVRNFVETFNRSRFIFEGNELTLRVTAGLSNESPEKVMTTCDLAKQYAKKHAKDLIVYSSQMGLEEEVRKNMSCALRLQKAIDEDRVTLFVQPIVDARTLIAEKYECLVRIIEEDGSILTPYHFLDVAKHSKQYEELSKVIITKAFEMIKSYPGMTFSINLTIQDILNEEICELIFERLAAVGSEKQVVFELVESEGIENFTEVNRFIKEIKKMGAQLAIDDFGTGYSNFEYLLRLDADIIKIDGSLIRNIVASSDIEEIVKLIVAFAQSQKMETVAEFVSSEEILEKVRSIGIDQVQGYHVGMPRAQV